MTAAGIASAAAGDMAHVVADCQRAKQLIQEAANVLFVAKQRAVDAKGKIASATRTVTGGIGTGQSLQVQCGQSQVKLDEVIKLLSGVIKRDEDTATHAAMVEGQIRQWAGTLIR